MARLLIFGIITIILFSFANVISILDKLFEGFRPVIFKLRKDLRLLQPELKSWAAEHLINWDRNEMELLSLRQHRQIKKAFGHRMIRGVFQSIYHEPLVVYLQKVYRPEESVLIVRNSKNEFAYVITKEVEVFINEEYFGKLDRKGKLWYNERNVIAQIDRGDQALLAVHVNSKLAGNIINEAKKETRNPRAFQYLSEMDDVEEKVFLAMSYFELIRRSPGK
ncbi:MAG: hypothetical protein ABI844_12390 [Saprospiraceae bacterium]